jgi:hypothetical protein
MEKAVVCSERARGLDDETTFQYTLVLVCCGIFQRVLEISAIAAILGNYFCAKLRVILFGRL